MAVKLLVIKDTSLLWLINKYLKAGVITEGVYEDSEEGIGIPVSAGMVYSALAAGICFAEYVYNPLRAFPQINSPE